MRARASLAVANHLQSLPAWTRTRHLALYLPADGEIETAALAEQAREAGMSLYLPVVGNDGVMQFALWEQGAPLQENRYGIPQPGPQYPLYPVHDLDVVLMPLVGWSKSGARLGMGGGFYDRALAGDKGPVRIGLGFECQQVQHLPTEDWDVPMDFVATEAALHCCREEA
jgi:5-formyltetrahydrofolate cyclo-ligase